MHRRHRPFVLAVRGLSSLAAIALATIGCTAQTPVDSDASPDASPDRSGIAPAIAALPTPYPQCYDPQYHPKCIDHYCSRCENQGEPNACALCSPACGDEGALQWSWSREPAQYVLPGMQHYERGSGVTVAKDGAVAISSLAYFFDLPYGLDSFSEGSLYAFDPSGAEQWRVDPGLSGPYDYWSGLVRDADDDLVAVGQSFDFGSPQNGAVLRSHAPGGAENWNIQSVPAGVPSAMASGIQVAPGDELVVAGVAIEGIDQWTWARRYASDGTFVSGFDLPPAVEVVVDFGVDGHGRVIMGGRTPSGGNDWLRAHDPDGSVEFSTPVVGQGGAALEVDAVDSHGAGLTAVVAHPTGSALSRVQVYDGSGVRLWEAAVHPGGYDGTQETFVDVSFSPDGTVVVVGEIAGGAEAPVPFARKFGHFGQELWTTTLDPSATGRALQVDVGVGCEIGVAGAIAKPPTPGGGGPIPPGTEFDVPSVAVLSG